MTTEGQVPEAVLLHNSRHVMTTPDASPTAVNQPHAVEPHPFQLQQHSAAGHFTAGVQHHEHEPVQQAQADALSVARGEEPRRKRRKTAGIPFSAARLTLPTALSTAAATQAASAHIPVPHEVSAAAATAASAAASTAASAAASTAAVGAQTLAPGMARPAEVHYQQGDVVWAKFAGDPYWPARVQKPTWQQHKDSKMGPGKVFVVYFGTNEISALPINRIKSWGAQPVPRAAVGDLLKPDRL
ncbi:TPA: hypothetical protein ACH3X1_006961 [Trebouxia sp. C0004]